MGYCGMELNYGVVVVGYGLDLKGRKYWIVRNLWGFEWGEGGYINFERGIDDFEGKCGIVMEVFYLVKFLFFNLDKDDDVKDEF